MWRAYYYDGTTFDGPGKPPGFGAVLIRQDRADGDSMIVSGEHSSEKGYFAQVDGEWKAVDARALCSLACNRPESLGFAVEGTWMEGAKWEAMKIRVMNDADFRETYKGGEG